MGWRIIVFYPEPEARDKSTNIRQPMLKLKAHSGFHVMEYKQVPCVWRMSYAQQQASIVWSGHWCTLLQCIFSDPIYLS
jgi:hypothetical protein